MVPGSMSTDTSSAPARRICDYLQRKQELVEQASHAFAPVVEAFLGDLCADLRQCRPQVPDALLLEMFLSGVGIEDETRSRCIETCRRYSEICGLGIRQHFLQVEGDDATVTLDFEMLNALRRRIAESLGEHVPVMLRVQLHSSDDGIRDITLVNADRLELVDLESLCGALAGYWTAAGGDGA